MDRLESILEQLELTDFGNMPYRESDSERISMYREQEAVLEKIEWAARALRFKIITERKSYDALKLPKPKKERPPLPPKVQEFFRRLKSGTDWGPIEFKMRWQSDDGRFLIWTRPGHLFWNGIGSPGKYAQTCHAVSDLSKMGPEPKFESGLSLANKCQVREDEGRLTKVQLADMIASANRAANAGPLTKLEKERT
jgi:hypothetical protein